MKSARMNIIFIELPKIADLPDEPIEKLTHGQRWGKFFLYADCKDKIEYIQKLVQSEEGLMYAQNALSSISQSDAEWRRERDFIDAELTANTIRNQARKNGYKEGFSIGEKSGMQQKAVEAALMLIKDYNASPEIAAQKMNAPLDLVLEGLKKKA